MLMVGYFEDIDSQHGIVWRCSDSLSLTSFLGCQPQEATAEHSSLTRITSRLPLEIDREVLAFVLPLLHEQGLLKRTTLEANAALTSIERKGSGVDWETHLKTLAAAEWIEISWRADAARFDQQRAKTGKKKCSHDDWPSPSDPDGRITKMRAGSTHLAYKAENAVDLDTGASTAAEIDHADQADSATREDTRRFAAGQIAEVAGDPLCQEGVADKGDLKNETGPVISDIGTGLRTDISERLVPQGRTWTDKAVEQCHAFRTNHRRIRSERGKRLLRRRGTVVERMFAHLCETGSGLRTWRRGLTTVTKRDHVLALSHNRGLILRNLCGAAKPGAFTLVLRLGTLRRATLRTLKPISHPQPDFPMFKITYSQTALATGLRRSHNDKLRRLQQATTVQSDSVEF